MSRAEPLLTSSPEAASPVVIAASRARARCPAASVCASPAWVAYRCVLLGDLLVVFGNLCLVIGLVAGADPGADRADRARCGAGGAQARR
jgi:hypothetical protein